MVRNLDQLAAVPSGVPAIDRDAIQRLRSERLPPGTKGLPLGRHRLTVDDLATGGFNVLGDELPLPALTRGASPLANNVALMADYCGERPILLDVPVFSARLPGARVTSLCLAKEKSPRERPPREHVPSTSMCSGFASGRRGSPQAHPCACAELARILRAILRTFPSSARRVRGPHWALIVCA